jgi:hypothetical protein
MSATFDSGVLPLMGISTGDRDACGPSKHGRKSLESFVVDRDLGDLRNAYLSRIRALAMTGGRRTNIAHYREVRDK